MLRRDVKPGDPERVLGVVYPGFRPLQNREGAKIFDALIGHGARIYHTGGYLGNGEVVWLLARLRGEIKIAEDDVVEPYSFSPIVTTVQWSGFPEWPEDPSCTGNALGGTQRGHGIC